MIFNELYSAYYKAVAEILKCVANGETSEALLRQKVTDHAFSESVLSILPSLKSEKWQLMKRDMTSPIKHAPSIPVTLLEKRWLKAVMLDPRISLFDFHIDGLEDIEPLFTPDDYCIYDIYADGDPYADEKYITHFRILLDALKNKYPLSIKTVNRKGHIVSMNVMPHHLEYSEKDDKFRLITTCCRYGQTINVSRIVNVCKYGSSFIPQNDNQEENMRSVTLQIFDYRNALERCMLHFAHFEKQVERGENNDYILKIKYSESDETEMVIRILSYGPMVRVTQPQYFVDLIKERLIEQLDCELR